MRINRNNEANAAPETPAQQPAPQSEQKAAARPAADKAAAPARAAKAEKAAKPTAAAQSARAAAPKKAKPAPKPAKAPKAYDYEADTAEEYEDEAPARRRFPVGLVIVLVVLALVAFGAYKVMQFYNELDGKTERGAEQVVTVSEGESVGEIAAQLKDAGIIEYDWLFKQYVKYSGLAGGIQYGDFTLRSGMGYNEIINIMSQVVRRKTVDVTIPEGTTAVGVAQIFVDAGLVDSVDTFLSCACGLDGSTFDYDFWNAIPDNGRLMKCEGYLFPDTYNVYADEDVYYYVDTLYKEFDAQTAALADTLAEKNMTLDDAVNLASFIQEEAGVESEDAKVSACFHNRLESDDPLWAEHKLESNACSYITKDTENNYLWNSPTAEYYGWPEQGAIPQEVLDLYDTYTISGLPAGPISNPGYAAIEAALNPDQTYLDEGYYFFVTGNPDGDHPGEYFYAKTADEHYQNCITAGWPPA